MNLLKTALALCFALSFALATAVPARADPAHPALVVRKNARSATATAQDAGFRTGLSAPDVGPLMKGVVAEGVQMAVFAGCFLALDDNQTCIELAGKARDDIANRS